MSPKAERVFRGWVQLSLAEKQEFQQECSHYIQAPWREQERLIEKAVLGPVTTVCPFCGK
jgi:hypothetical protein